jgi:hypothetical protein
MTDKDKKNWMEKACTYRAKACLNRACGHQAACVGGFRGKRVNKNIENRGETKDETSQSGNGRGEVETLSMTMSTMVFIGAPETPTARSRTVS